MAIQMAHWFPSFIASSNPLLWGRTTRETTMVLTVTAQFQKSSWSLHQPWSQTRVSIPKFTFHSFFLELIHVYSIWVGVLDKRLWAWFHADLFSLLLFLVLSKILQLSRNDSRVHLKWPSCGKKSKMNDHWNLFVFCCISQNKFIGLGVIQSV